MIPGISIVTNCPHSAAHVLLRQLRNYCGCPAVAGSGRYSLARNGFFLRCGAPTRYRQRQSEELLRQNCKLPRRETSRPASLNLRDARYRLDRSYRSPHVPYDVLALSTEHSVESCGATALLPFPTDKVLNCNAISELRLFRTHMRTNLSLELFVYMWCRYST